jgi:hypothetical protein
LKYTDMSRADYDRARRSRDSQRDLWFDICKADQVLAEKEGRTILPPDPEREAFRESEWRRDHEQHRPTKKPNPKKEEKSNDSEHVKQMKRSASPKPPKNPKNRIKKEGPRDSDDDIVNFRARQRRKFLAAQMRKQSRSRSRSRSRQ